MNGLLAGAGATATLSLLLAGCSTDNGQGLARQACQHVARSITDYHQAERTPSKTVARQKLTAASVQLSDALPYAARANSTNGQWNALMTTISEGGRVAEGYLIPALQDQCAVANSSGADQAPVPNNPGGGS